MFHFSVQHVCCPSDGWFDSLTIFHLQHNQSSVHTGSVDAARRRHRRNVIKHVEVEKVQSYRHKISASRLPTITLTLILTHPLIFRLHGPCLSRASLNYISADFSVDSADCYSFRAHRQSQTHTGENETAGAFTLGP